MHKRFLILLAATCSSTALAGTPQWKISETSGPVQVAHNGLVRVALRSGAVEAGDTVTTGRGGRAVLVRGSEFVMVAPGSQLRLPGDDQATGFTRVLQDFGSIVFMIKKKMTPHFEVKTPYLAAVVKGTTFTVAVTQQGASVQVLEGAVDVATVDGGAHDLITPGTVALVGASNRFQLKIDGERGSRVIDSPSSTGGSDQSSSGDTPSASPPAPQDATGPMLPSALEETATVTSVVYSEPVELSTITGGLVSGMSGGEIGGDLADVAQATRVANEASASVVKAVEVASAVLRAEKSQAIATNVAQDEILAVKQAASTQATTDQAILEAQRASEAAVQAANEKARSDAATAAASAAADEAVRQAAAAADEAAKAEADAAGKLAASEDASGAAAAAAVVAQAAQTAAAEAVARANSETDGAARDVAQKIAAEAAKNADKAVKEAEKANKNADRAAADAARSKSEKDARDAAKAAQDMAADWASKEADKAAQDAAKAANDKASKDAEKAAKDAEKDAAKQAAEAAKSQEAAARDAKKQADELARALANAANEAKDKGKDAHETAKAIQDLLKGKGG
ncbi:MAG: FecR family protein [Sphingobium sp.]|uniref:FecR family protein n=1 Tax=Sphingobium sp. CECT 9361 TaxID=2845384 RepID=UPI001E35E429|nr:FecR family protein [Sphingobium sp. CECT 9361]CAH0356500.1 hypothetical protein SPH9361_04140 [Sphingobium sp. CECT 9361]